MLLRWPEIPEFTYWYLLASALESCMGTGICYHPQPYPHVLYTSPTIPASIFPHPQPSLQMVCHAPYCPRKHLPLVQAEWMISLTADTNPAAWLLYCLEINHDRGIRHHFRSNPCSGCPHYRGITAYFTAVTADFPRLPRYYRCPHYRAGFFSALGNVAVTGIWVLFV